MSQSRTPNTEPRLCKMGCGFFGSGATEDCCSKCFLELQKKQTCVAVQPKVEKKVEPITSIVEPVQSMNVDDATPMEEDKPAAAPIVAAAPTKKKKKKASYKAMMQSMTKPTGSRDAEKDKETIRKATGGGAFSKIDKI